MKLFVSYARVDKPLVAALVSDIRALGHEAFYDRDLAGGQRWWEALLDQIQQCDAFMPVLSEGYRSSQACRAEASWGESLGVPFVPVVVGEQLPGLYDPTIAEANWVEYDPESRSALADLARGIAATPSFTLPQPLPERPVIPLSYLSAIDRQIRQPIEISRGDQLVLVSDLRSKLGTRDDSMARELLGMLHARPEITHEAAVMIEGLLGPASVTDPATAEFSPAPAPPPQRSRPLPKALTATAPGFDREHSAAGPVKLLSRVRWSWSTVVAAVGALLSLIAMTREDFWRYSSSGYSLLSGRISGGFFSIPLFVMVLALAAVAVTCQLRRVPRTLRRIAATLDVLLALVAVIVPIARADIDGITGGTGPWLLAAALLLLAVATLWPDETDDQPLRR